MRRRAYVVLGTAMLCATIAAMLLAQPSEAPAPKPIPCAAEAAFVADLVTVRGWRGFTARGHDIVKEASDNLLDCAQTHYPPQ